MGHPYIQWHGYLLCLYLLPRWWCVSCWRTWANTGHSSCPRSGESSPSQAWLSSAVPYSSATWEGRSTSWPTPWSDGGTRAAALPRKPPPIILSPAEFQKRTETQLDRRHRPSNWRPMTYKTQVWAANYLALTTFHWQVEQTRKTSLSAQFSTQKSSQMPG